MTRRNYWRLTIHFYPNAAEAGVSPVQVIAYTQTDLPGRYRAHSFDFDHPPSRADFLAVMGQLPYMQVHKDSMFPLIAAHPFPVIEMGKKSVRQELFKDGVQVGHLDIDKRDMWENAVKPTVFISFDTIEGKIKRQPADLRDSLRAYLRTWENEMLEKIQSGGDVEEVVTETVKRWRKERKKELVG